MKKKISGRLIAAIYNRGLKIDVQTKGSCDKQSGISK